MPAKKSATKGSAKASRALKAAQKKVRVETLKQKIARSRAELKRLRTKKR